MKIAVTYADGQVQGHFGHAELFRVYEVNEEKQVVSETELVPAGGGHNYMVQLMKDNGINAVICGSMGMHAADALEEAGIDYVIGVEGDASEAVQLYLDGELLSGGAGECCHGEGHSEEGGCCGGCHGREVEIIMEGKNAGKTVKAHYRGTFNDGTQFDSSYDRGEPLEFICGAGQMISGFDAAVVNMEVGEEVDIHLMPEEAYGQADPNAIFTIEIAQLPGSEELEAGQRVALMNQFGQPVPVLVVEKTETEITFDANHEMAGKELNFHIELVEVSE